MITLSFRALGKALLSALALMPGAASAAPGNQLSKTGAAQALVVLPFQIIAMDALRFGQIVSPTTSGTIVLSPLGVITATGGLLPSTAIIQTVSRGPGSFLITGNPNRQFVVDLPNGSIILRSGTRNLRMSAMSSNVSTTVNPRLDASGFFVLTVGATLNIAADQQIGTYTGTYAATVVYQ
jgi:Domain of unknown function (DUF4402)